MSILESSLKAMGIPAFPHLLEKIQGYIRELELWNPKYGLVKASGDDLIIRHILDSLAAVPFLERLSPASVADVGSGAGLPGIPLSLFFPEVSFTLIERSGKRADFLENTVNYLGLSNVRVVSQPVEEVLEQFDWITFRAVSALTPDFLNTLTKRLRPGGRIVSFKGKQSVITQELAQLQEGAFEYLVEGVEIPGLEEERHLVFLSPLV